MHVRPSARGGPDRASVIRMPVIPQQAISPEGGEAERISVRLPRGCNARIEQAARHRGMTKSELIRIAVEAEIEKAARQEDAKAS